MDPLPSPSKSASSSRFRSSSSLDASAASPPKRPRLEPADSKAQSVAAAHLSPPAYFSSSSAMPLASAPFPGRFVHAAPPTRRGPPPRSKAVPAAAAPGTALQATAICAYQQAANRTVVQWTPDGAVFRNFAIGNEALRPIELIGQGDSFQCFKIETPEGVKVIKIFKSFTDGLIGRKQLGKGNAQAIFDQRMDFLKKNFDFYQSLDIPCALILNADTANMLKMDGYVLQEYVPEKVISWSQNSGDLSNEQIETLQQFLGVLKLAFIHHKENCWDLAPRNFCLKDKRVTLLDFTDKPLEDQWKIFPNAIRAWANGNPSAQKLIATDLQKCFTDAEPGHVKNQIKTLITTLGWQ